MARAVLGQKQSAVEFMFDSQYGYPSRIYAINNNPGGPLSARASNLKPIQYGPMQTRSRRTPIAGAFPIHDADACRFCEVSFDAYTRTSNHGS